MSALHRLLMGWLTPSNTDKKRVLGLNLPKDSLNTPISLVKLAGMLLDALVLLILILLIEPINNRVFECTLSF